MDRAEIVRMLEEIAPPLLALDFDVGRTGLIVEGSTKVKKVCCALDATVNVAKRAVDLGVDMLVVHHTPLFTPVTSVTGENARLLGVLLSNEINLYVMHTNFDRAGSGINDTLADMLCLSSRVQMSLGVIGNCPMSLNEVSNILGPLRVYGGIPDFSFLAIVGGSGFSLDLIEEACSLGAPSFLSSELKHSVIRSSHIPLLESTHYALENPGMRSLSERMGWEFIDDPPSLSMAI